MENGALSADELKLAVSYLLDQAARLDVGVDADPGAVRLLKEAAARSTREVFVLRDALTKAMTVELQDAVAAVYADFQADPTIDLRDRLGRITLTGGAYLPPRVVEALLVTPEYIKEERGPVESACKMIANFMGLSDRTMFNWRREQPTPPQGSTSVDQFRVVLQALWSIDGSSGLGKEILVLVERLEQPCASHGASVAPPPSPSTLPRLHARDSDSTDDPSP